jgi:hypothetical protein
MTAEPTHHFRPKLPVGVWVILLVAICVRGFGLVVAFASATGAQEWRQTPLTMGTSVVFESATLIAASLLLGPWRLAVGAWVLVLELDLFAQATRMFEGLGTLDRVLSTAAHPSVIVVVGTLAVVFSLGIDLLAIDYAGRLGNAGVLE